jgi:hypothetical protein
MYWTFSESTNGNPNAGPMSPYALMPAVSNRSDLVTEMNAVNKHYLIVNRFVVVGKYYFRHVFPTDKNLLQ